MAIFNDTPAPYHCDRNVPVSENSAIDIWLEPSQTADLDYAISIEISMRAPDRSAIWCYASAALSLLPSPGAILTGGVKIEDGTDWRPSDLTSHLRIGPNIICWCRLDREPEP